MAKNTDDKVDVVDCYSPVVTEDVEVGADELDDVFADGRDGAHDVDEGHHDQHLIQLSLRRITGPVICLSSH